MKGFSIIVCCYNSATVLPETLRRLSRLKIREGLGVELIVVDNCCTDQTVQIAETEWLHAGSPFHLTIAEENIPGLSAAREKGISLAQYDYLVFCDDDNRLNDNYLMVAEQFLSAHPRVGALGGLGIPEWEALPVYWPDDFYIYGSGPQGAKSGKMPFVHGAGIIIRKAAYAALKKADFTFILSDRKQNQLSSGGDYELCCALALAGYDIWYEQQLQFSHFISSERITWAYCKKFIQQSTPALDVLDIYHFILRHREKEGGINQFYGHQLKVLLYHMKELLVSTCRSVYYRRHPKVHFLERFHQLFHLERVKYICINVLSYKAYYRKIHALKFRL